MINLRQTEARRKYNNNMELRVFSVSKENY